MAEVEAADRGCRQHGEVLGEVDAGALLHLQKVEEPALFSVVRTGWIARGRPDAAVASVDQILRAQVFIPAIAPLAARPLVQKFRKGFGQTVGQGFEHDGAVIVVGLLQALYLRFEPQPCRDRKAADVVGQTALLRGDKVGQGAVGFVRIALGCLLAQGVEARDLLLTDLVRVQGDVVADAVGREESVHGRGPEPFFPDDLVQQLPGVGKEFARLLPEGRVLQDARIPAAEFPHVEEGRPVDVGHDGFQGEVVEGADAEKLGPANLGGVPRDRHLVLARLGIGQERLFPGAVLKGNAPAFLLLAVVLDQLLSEGRIEQLADHPGGAGSVEHVDGRVAVGRRDLHGGVLLAGGSAADQQGYGKALALHFPGHVHHFVQGRRDQTAEPDDIDFLFAGASEDLFGRHHDPQILDLVVVAAQNHGHDVLADVVDVAFDRGQEEFAPGTALPTLPLGLVHQRFEIDHGLFHDPGAFDHLGQKHLALPEEIADHVHAVHQGPLDDVEGGGRLLQHLFQVNLDVLGLAVLQGVFEPLFDLFPAPGPLLLPGLAPLLLDRLGKGDQAFGGVGPAVEEHILEIFPQLRGDVLVDHELAGVDDAHVHAGPGRVVEEDRVHGLAHEFIAAK